MLTIADSMNHRHALRVVACTEPDECRIMLFVVVRHSPNPTNHTSMQPANRLAARYLTRVDMTHLGSLNVAMIFSVLVELANGAQVSAGGNDSTTSGPRLWVHAAERERARPVR